ncbi:unnamed protein product [Porites lobata]|uniref:Uncharacterized protein n=1 Tax=Porites lobata TaxID=104759 RepID=A0ABN8RXM7_9CNID|nr:unnamed protein product [Porites lobata]
MQERQEELESNNKRLQQEEQDLREKYHELTETIQLLAEDILERRQETTRLHRCLCKLAGKVTNVFFRLYELQSTLCKKDIFRTGLSV